MFSLAIYVIRYLIIRWKTFKKNFKAKPQKLQKPKFIFPFE